MNEDREEGTSRGRVEDQLGNSYSVGNLGKPVGWDDIDDAPNYNSGHGPHDWGQKCEAAG